MHSTCSYAKPTGFCEHEQRKRSAERKKAKFVVKCGGLPANAGREASVVGGRGKETADQQNVEGGFKFRSGGAVIGGPITPCSKVLSTSPKFSLSSF